MIDPTTLEDLLAPLEKETTGHRETALVEDVAANLATYFDDLVEPRLHELVRDLSWKRRAALAGALGLVMPTPARDAVLARLLADLHREVSRQALLSYRGPVDPDALAGVRALAAKGVVHAEHVRALATAHDRADEATFRASASARDDLLAVAALTALGGLPAVDRASLEVIVAGLGRSDLRYPAGEALAALAASWSPEAIHRELTGSPALATLAKLVERADHEHQAQLRAIVGAGRPSVAPGAAPAPAPPPVARELAGYGAVLDGTSPDHAVRVGDDATVAELARLLTGSPRRSVVLVGPNGAGKTSLVHALARRLRDECTGFVVLETSSGEILAGTKYLGEWETRLKKLIDAARAPARVILYVTDVASLGAQGRSADRDGSFADVLAPYLDRGELAIVGEATDDALRTGVDRHPAMRRLFSRIRVRDATPAEAAAVVRGRIEAASRDGAVVSAAPAVVEQIVEMASLAVPGAAAPGAACRLLDRMVEVANERSPRGAGEMVLEPSDVIAAISRATGMPTQLLDDRQPFDRAAVRAFFEERVLGQPEAIDVVVELVTLVKAGLTDPDRPYGSLFFVGPTGVGKTEIAKALAEHLFGSPDRMIRIDMSELKQWDSHERLIGSAMRPNDGMLTKRVAEQPFSVVLLDEIEKAHPNVHDLLLQVLDDGRLTDARGQTIDFRRTVVVMTSNVGSRIDVDAVGFGARAQAPSEDAVMREVRGVFRPELVNRFGRIVVFRPLSPETMRTLVRRELGKVVLRSGVLRRRLAVDLAPELVDLLVREGFSPAYGARPLKRRVERRVLLPIAELIVSLGPDAAGTILRAAVEGDRIAVRAIAPQVEAQPVRERPSGAARTLAAAGERLAELVRRARSLADHPRVGVAERRRAELLADTSRRTFWDDAERARAAMTELAELDDRESARATLERRIEGAGDLLRDRRAAGAARAHDVLDELERGLAMLEHRYLVEEPGDRADVIVQLTRIGSGAESAQLLTTLAGIYEAWAAKHGVRATVLDGAGEDASSITLHLDGHGLYGLFRDEAGLHRLADAGRGSDRKRFAVRATVMACPETPLPGTSVERAAVRGKTRFVVSHAASERALEAELPDVRGRDAEIERLLGCWLRARVSGSGSARDDVVRRYGVEDRYAVDEASGVRVRTKDLATTGLDAIFDARVRARLEARRAAGE